MPTLPVFSQAPPVQGSCVAYCGGGRSAPSGNNGALSPLGKVLIITVISGLVVFLVYMQVEHG